MIAVIAFDPGETLVKVTAVKVLIYYVQNMGPPIPVLLLVTAVPCAFKLLKMRFNTPVVYFIPDSNLYLIVLGLYEARGAEFSVPMPLAFINKMYFLRLIFKNTECHL